MYIDSTLSHGTSGTETNLIATPIAIFVSHLLSLGHMGQELAEIIRLAEAAFRNPSKSGISIEKQREKDRIRKAAYRAKLAAVSHDVPVLSHGTDSDSSSFLLTNTKTLNLSKKERKEVSKKEGVVPSCPMGQTAGQIDDGWPEDHLEIFWKSFPPYRREGKRKVGEKLSRLRKDKIIDWPTLIGAVEKFAATNPGEYAPAPLVWLNGEKWDREYGGRNEANRSNGSKVGFAGLAARLRRDVEQKRSASFDFTATAGPRAGD